VAHSCRALFLLRPLCRVCNALQKSIKCRALFLLRPLCSMKCTPEINQMQGTVFAAPTVQSMQCTPEINQMQGTVFAAPTVQYAMHSRNQSRKRGLVGLQHLICVSPMHRAERMRQNKDWCCNIVRPSLKRVPSAVCSQVWVLRGKQLHSKIKGFLRCMRWMGLPSFGGCDAECRGWCMALPQSECGQGTQSQAS